MLLEFFQLVRTDGLAERCSRLPWLPWINFIVEGVFVVVGIEDLRIDRRINNEMIHSFRSFPAASKS